jgi:hypothetical protein
VIHWRVAVACALALSLRASVLAAQGMGYVPLDHPVMSTVDALVARGALPGLSALERPYATRELMRAADSALVIEPKGIPPRWLHAVRAAVARHGGLTRDTVLAARISVSPMVTAQTSGSRELMLPSGPGGTRPGVEVAFGFGSDRLAGVARLRIDQTLKTDPEFVGKRDRAVAARMEDAYLVGTWRFASIAFGRVARNWGPGPLDGLQVGRYADTYDHLFARIGVDRMHLSTIVARLDDMQVGDSVAQRYFTAHRVAVRWRQLEAAATETVVYGGVARGFEPGLANPLGVLSLLQYTERKALNLAYGVDVAVRSRFGLVGAQLLLDDFQVDECGENCEEPSSTGLTLVMEGLPIGGIVRAFASYTRVSNLTYRAPAPWERYTWLDLGLGRGQSDYDEGRAGIELAPPVGGPLRIYFARRRQGEGDYRTAFPTPAEYPATPAIFEGMVATSRRAGVQWSSTGLVSVAADVGYQWTLSAGHVRGERASGMEARLRVSVPFSRSMVLQPGA